MRPPIVCFGTLRCLVILGLAAFIVMDASNQTAVVEWGVDRLADYMDILCPYDTICRSGEPKLQITPGQGMQSCCIGCSCDESCGQTQNCCFPDQDVHTTVDRSRRECVAATSRVVDRQSIRDYYMVVDGHSGGTGELCGEESNTTCGGNDAATQLGSLFPVTSRATGVINKNALCALCHGVNKSEQLPWDAVLTCDVDFNAETNMDTYFRALESGKLPSVCKYEFYHPASQSDANEDACYENTIHSCKIIGAEPYTIPEHLNMTDEEVRAACVRDLFAPYMKRYFNAFCYICNYGRFYYANTQCRKSESHRKAPGGGMSSFTALIDPKYLDEKTKVTSEEPNLLQRIACRIRKEHNKEDSDCRPVLCPSGQVRLGQSCVYPSQQLLSKNVKLVVKLYPREVMHASSIEILKRHFRNGLSWKTLLQSKDLRSWQLFVLYFNETMSDVGEITISYLCATFTTVRRNSSLQSIVTNVETIMKKDWTFRIDDQDALFQPRFFEFKSISVAMNETQPLASWDEIIDANLPPFANVIVRPTLKSNLIGRAFMNYLSITKMMFCDQVALEKDEYLLDAVHRRLYVNATGRLLFPQEFSIGYEMTAGIVPKLCLDDAGFAVQSNTASGISVTVLTLILMTVVPDLLRFVME